VIPIPTPIYHITHIKNLSSILKHRGLLANSFVHNKRISYSSIAHRNIQTSRLNTSVPYHPFKRIIRGFETPYGLELLATVHWVMKETPIIASNPEEVIKSVQEWNERKKRIFKEDHIYKAWQHLSNIYVQNIVTS
jgi:hypothetical protein